MHKVLILNNYYSIYIYNIFIDKNNCWKSFGQPIMQYYQNCVYAATLRKTTPEIVTPTDEELFHVQVDGIKNHLETYI